jgi:CBS domain containing-hemolysin-like protein
MIHSRDILNDVLESKKLDISKLVRPIIMVPENTSISSILTRMNKSRIHLALVVDEYGGTSGLITMDDILEEIIGETTDEHDPKDESILLIDENRYEFDGIVNIEKVEELLDIEFEKDELSAVTIGGRILNLIGRLPIEGETINDKDCTYKILAVNNNRITKILCEKKIKEEETKV